MNSTEAFKASAVLSVCLLLLASFVIVVAPTAFDSDAKSDDYYFSGELMEVLSDSDGVNENTKSTIWTTDGVRGYAIVGEYVFMSDKNGDLIKKEIKTGKEVKKVPTGVSSGNDYLAVGGGHILDPASGNVYDLELNQEYSLGITSDQGYYEDGYWYVVKGDKTCNCFSATDEDKSKPDNVQSIKWSEPFIFYIDGFTLTVSLAFNDKYIFYPGIGESDTALRILYCVDKSTGKQVDSIEMTDIKSTFWNSGFIQCFNDKVIVTTHWDNMYGPVHEGPDYKVMYTVDVGSDGKFKADTAKYLSNGFNDTYGSCLVVVDGLGYAQTGLRFEVFDMKTGSVIASTDKDSRLGKTYSNIAVAAGDDGYVRGYVSPAGVPNPLTPVDGLICFEYNVKTKEIRTFDLKVGTAVADNTNSVKIGPNGEVVFAKNDGKLYCITSLHERSSGSDSTMTIVLVVVVIVLLIALVVFLARYKGRQQTP